MKDLFDSSDVPELFELHADDLADKADEIQRQHNYVKLSFLRL